MPKKMSPEGGAPELGQEEREETKLEWGPAFGAMTQIRGIEKSAELNESLPEGKKKWRLPTVEELKAEFEKTGSTPVGFQSACYWSSTMDLTYSNLAYFVNMSNGDVDSSSIKDKTLGCVRLVRDAA